MDTAQPWCASAALSLSSSVNVSEVEALADTANAIVNDCAIQRDVLFRNDLDGLLSNNAS